MGLCQFLKEDIVSHKMKTDTKATNDLKFSRKIL